MHKTFHLSDDVDVLCLSRTEKKKRTRQQVCVDITTRREEYAKKRKRLIVAASNINISWNNLQTNRKKSNKKIYKIIKEIAYEMTRT